MGDPPWPPPTAITAHERPSIGDRLISSTITATSWINMDTSGPDSPVRGPSRSPGGQLRHRQGQPAAHRGRAGSVIIDCIFPPTLPGFDADCHPYPHSLRDGQGARWPRPATPASRRPSTATTASVPAVGRVDQDRPCGHRHRCRYRAQRLRHVPGHRVHAPCRPDGAGWLVQDFPDPSDFIDPLFTCSTAVEGGQNLSAYCDPAVDARLAAARRIVDIDGGDPGISGHPGHHHGRGTHRACPGAHPGRGHLGSGHRLRPLPPGLGLGLRDHRAQ